MGSERAGVASAAPAACELCGRPGGVLAVIETGRPRQRGARVVQMDRMAMVCSRHELTPLDTVSPAPARKVRVLAGLAGAGSVSGGRVGAATAAPATCELCGAQDVPLARVILTNIETGPPIVEKESLVTICSRHERLDGETGVLKHGGEAFAKADAFIERAKRVFPGSYEER